MEIKLDLTCTIDCPMEHVHSFERARPDWVAIIAMLKEARHHVLLKEIEQLARDKA